MNKSRITIIIFFGVLGILLMLYFIFNAGDEKKYQWYESYRVDSDQPYGTLFIKRLLENYRPGGHFTFNDKKPLQSLLADTQRNTDYVFIGESIHLDYQDVDALLKFIHQGNDAFISSLELPTSILYRFYQNECGKDIYIQENNVKSVTLNFYHDTLSTQDGYTYAFRFGSEDVSYFWNSLTAEAFCDSTKTIVPLGYQSPNRVNFFKLTYGKGNLYIYTNPIVFTNYFLSKPDKAAYASSVFSHLKNKNIIWDEYSKIPFVGNNNAYNSPLYFILSIPNLKYAWWMLLISILLYVLFVAKRTQRVIPVLEVKANTSLEFVKLISALHFQNSNHLDMARKKMKYFQYFIRSKYGIHAQTFTEEQIVRLAQKSKVNKSTVQVIFDQYAFIEHNAYYNTEPDRLINFYLAIENFYKHCK